MHPRPGIASELVRVLAALTSSFLAEGVSD